MNLSRWGEGSSGGRLGGPCGWVNLECWCSGGNLDQGVGHCSHHLAGNVGKGSSQVGCTVKWLECPPRDRLQVWGAVRRCLDGGGGHVNIDALLGGPPLENVEGDVPALLLHDELGHVSVGSGYGGEGGFDVQGESQGSWEHFSRGDSVDQGMGTRPGGRGRYGNKGPLRCSDE